MTRKTVNTVVTIGTFAAGIFWMLLIILMLVADAEGIQL